MDNGSKLRIYSLLRGLSGHHKITLISFIDDQGADPEVLQEKSICENIVPVPFMHQSSDGYREKLGILSATPRYYKETYSPEMAWQIEAAVETGEYDLIIASQIDTAAYFKHFKRVPAIFDEVEIGLLYERFSTAKKIMQRVRHGLTWEKHRRYLARILKVYLACTVTSADERHLLKKVIPDLPPVHFIPNCIEYDEYQGIGESAQPNTLIFTGSFRYTPNYEAMEWFIQFVLPRLKERIPGIRLIITGDSAGKDVSDLPLIEQTGYVDDIRALVASSWVSLAPLLSGGGTRLKDTRSHGTWGAGRSDHQRRSGAGCVLR